MSAGGDFGSEEAETPFHQRVRARLRELEDEYTHLRQDLVHRTFRSDHERESVLSREQGLSLIISELRALLREGN